MIAFNIIVGVCFTIALISLVGLVFVGVNEQRKDNEEKIMENKAFRVFLYIAIISVVIAFIVTMWLGLLVWWS